ncbi:unnamed protein product [Caenorhabditis bovis]|uniref:Uncharacterized protein n=1 Tax=Caenorhabditis bovis TaxID=2654633 RepID=A0A8S1E8Q6_9PELO|nr:unnamed protein product [Caenorhabditis bovis]
MNTMTVVVFAVCALLLISSIDCKKVGKGQKKSAKEQKMKKVKEQVEVVEVAAPKSAVVVEETVAEPEEEIVEAPVSPRKAKVTPPKTLKVINAYEQCKAECRRQRDTVQAKDYVEQLRNELAAAEAALAAETQQQEEQAPAQVNPPTSNSSN